MSGEGNNRTEMTFTLVVEPKEENGSLPFPETLAAYITDYIGDWSKHEEQVPWRVISARPVKMTEITGTGGGTQ